MGVSVYFFLKYDPGFERSTFVNWKRGRNELKSIFMIFLPSAAIMLAMIWIIDPDRVFGLARTNPLLLLLISIFYPVFSVIPQGLAYRALFFHRYAELFRGKIPGILASAAFFSFGHILYKNWLVLVLTFIAGLIFGWRYERSKSLAISIIEHALYGVWLFACGLGYFFVSAVVE
jgi:membrane protease YdiL (CAAX protease family)